MSNCSAETKKKKKKKNKEASMTTFLDRYLHGEYERVWDELYAQGEAIHQEPLLKDAVAVGKETMLRVRTNIESNNRPFGFSRILFWYLSRWGYQNLWVYPSPSSQKDILRKGLQSLSSEKVWVNSQVLKTFLANRWGCRLDGYHPLWPEYSNPLVVYPIEAAKSEYEDWRYAVNEGDREAGQFGNTHCPRLFS